MSLDNKIKEIVESHMEWKLYKILYIGILVPLLFKESKKWFFQDFSISIIFFATAIILLLPILFKIMNILKIIEEFE